MVLKIVFILLFCLQIVNSIKPQLGNFASPVFVVEQNESFLLSCNVLKGTKPVRFEWYKNGKKLSTNSGIVLDTKSSSSSLTIDSMLMQHSGNYSCRAQNNHGFDQVATILQVKGLSFFNYFFPQYFFLSFFTAMWR